jgi:RNA polymerase sigma factor (sigma-70 family)
MTIFANDANLLRRFRAGESGALSAVYWFYVARVEGMVRRAGRVGAELPDLVQEVFARAFATSARLAYDGTREYGPLLMTIARNTVIDHLRRQGREFQADPSRIEQMLEGEPEGDTALVPWADPPTMLVVEHYIAGLSGPDAEVYEQRYHRGQSQEQTAIALSMTRQRVRTVEQHLRAGLVRALARESLRPGSAHRGVRRIPEAMTAQMSTKLEKG